MSAPSNPATEEARKEAEGHEEDAKGRGHVLQIERDADAESSQGSAYDRLIDKAALIVDECLELLAWRFNHVQLTGEEESAYHHQHAQHADSLKDIK